MSGAWIPGCVVCVLMGRRLDATTLIGGHPVCGDHVLLLAQQLAVAPAAGLLRAARIAGDDVRPDQPREPA